MHILVKERWLNYKKFLLFALLLVSLFLSYFFGGGLFTLLFRFDTDAPDLAGGEEARDHFIEEGMNIHDYMNTQTCMNEIAPLIVFTFSVFFFQEKKTVFNQKYLRGQTRKRVILSALFSHSIFVGLGVYAVYLLYFIIGWFTMDIIPPLYPLTTFDAVLGSGFAENHIFAYYMLCAVYKAFCVGLFYSFFANCIALVVHKAYQAILFASLYFYGFSITCGALPLNRELFHAIQPSMIQGFDSYVYDPALIWDAFSPLCTFVIPLLISLGLIAYTLTRRERLEY